MSGFGEARGVPGGGRPAPEGAGRRLRSRGSQMRQGWAGATGSL
ncbi:hypothetical protein D516_2755 [Rhodobacter sp. AKP1]|nr:Hypothetical Protein RSKD131_1883 [Cereibacter sphaeroides KD131]EKX59599.1 hypothetical protein D516_2755 [Rhodobacter sp. AKP1]